MLLNYCLFTAFGSGSVPTYSCWFTRGDSDEEAEGGLVVMQRAYRVKIATVMSSAGKNLHGVRLYNTNFFFQLFALRFSSEHRAVYMNLKIKCWKVEK